MSFDKAILSKNKIPYDLDKFIGLEIEFLSEASEKAMQEWIIKNKLHYKWNLGSDGSIRSDRKKEVKVFDNIVIRDKFGNAIRDKYGEITFRKEWRTYKEEIGEGYELRILCKEKELDSNLTELKEFLSTHKAWVNKTCGLHVHLDMRSRNAEKCTELLTAKQDEMFSMMPKHRKSNKYCRKAKDSLIKKGLKADVSRYKAINTASYKQRGTIEIRLHEATIAIGEIKMWCKYLLSIIKESKRNKLVGKYVEQKIATNAS